MKQRSATCKSPSVSYYPPIISPSASFSYFSTISDYSFQFLIIATLPSILSSFCITSFPNSNCTSWKSFIYPNIPVRITLPNLDRSQYHWTVVSLAFLWYFLLLINNLVTHINTTACLPVFFSSPIQPSLLLYPVLKYLK